MAKKLSQQKREQVRSTVIRVRDELLRELREIKSQSRRGSDLLRLKYVESMIQSAEVLIALGVAA